MKKITAVLMVTVIMTMLLAGCGQKRELYNNVKLENYIEVKDYIGVEVDTTTDSFAKLCDEIFALDVEDNGLYNELKEGTVEDGDIVNLDYEGKLDGVAFDGGTAQGYDLKIGSKTFIDDFEEELIGVAVGETKDVTAKFPENYGNEELNGKEAVFTCKINSIQRAMTIEEAYAEMDFDSADDYSADIEKRAVKQSILDAISQTAKIKDYPAKDSEILCDAIYDYYVEFYKNMYQADLVDVLTASSKTVEEFKSQIASDMVPEMMNTNMLMYFILDEEKLEIMESTVNSQSTAQPAIAESYAVQDTVMEYLYENANIK